jgi:hypothetical protein
MPAYRIVAAPRYQRRLQTHDAFVEEIGKSNSVSGEAQRFLLE